MTVTIGRRKLLVALGGAAAAWPLAARGQQPERMRRVGVLVNSVEADPAVQGRIAAFRQALERLGWLEGRNIHIELRFSAANYERLPQLAQEMVAPPARRQPSKRCRPRPARSRLSSYTCPTRPVPASWPV